MSQAIFAMRARQSLSSSVYPVIASGSMGLNRDLSDQKVGLTWTGKLNPPRRVFGWEMLFELNLNCMKPELLQLSNIPIVFIHGNSDSALKFGENPFQSGWDDVIKFFMSKDYTLAELYGITYGDRNISNSYTRYRNPPRSSDLNPAILGNSIVTFSNFTVVSSNSFSTIPKPVVWTSLPTPWVWALPGRSFKVARYWNIAISFSTHNFSVHHEEWIVRPRTWSLPSCWNTHCSCVSQLRNVPLPTCICFPSVWNGCE